MNELNRAVFMLLNNIRPESDFSASTNFIQDGILDSYDLVTLVSALDEAFNLSIEGEDVVPENFCSLRAIVNLLSKYNINEKTFIRNEEGGGAG